MKNPIIIISVLCALAFSGCASTGTGAAPSSAFFAPLTRTTVALAAATALDKNPAYVPAAHAIAIGIDAAVLDAGVITPENIAAFVRTTAAKNNLPAIQTTLFVSLAQQIYSTYVATYRVQIVSATDPTVKLYVAAFRDGLNDAIAAIGSPQPSA